MIEWFGAEDFKFEAGEPESPLQRILRLIELKEKLWCRKKVCISSDLRVAAGYPQKGYWIRMEPFHVYWN
jgi:hypothetical protein